MQYNADIARAMLLAAGLWLGASGGAFAQDTTTEEPPEAGAETETDDQPQAAPQVGSPLSLGEDANTPTDLGQAYTKEVVGDWELRCLRTEVPEDDPCQMYQLLEDGEGAPIAEVSLFRLADGGQAVAGATVVVPLETALQNQLTIEVDAQRARRYPFSFCNAVGCYARVGLTEDDVNVFKRGNEAILTIVPAAAPNQQVKLALSLTGFTASFDQVSVIDPPQQ